MFFIEVTTKENKKYRVITTAAGMKSKKTKAGLIFTCKNMGQWNKNYFFSYLNMQVGWGQSAESDMIQCS